MENNNGTQNTVPGTNVGHNDYAVERIPMEKKRSVFNVSMVAIGFCISMAGLFTGASLAGGLNLKQAIIAAIVGNIILSFYGGLVGAAGAREGVSTAMLTRHSFGRMGSMIVSAIVAITLVGWYAVQVGFFGDTINAMFPNAGFITSKEVAGLWGGLLMMLTAYIGYRGLSILSNIAAPLIFITAIVGILQAIASKGGWSGVMAIVPEGSMTVSQGIVMIVGAFAVGAAIQSDITRYSRNAKQSWIATVIGYMIAHVFVIIAGYLTCLTTNTGDLPAAMLALGLGVPALICLIFAQWTTNDNNLYSSSLAWSNILKLKKSKIVLIIGVIATICGVAGVANYFVKWLILLGVCIPPMAGVIIADYYIIKKRKYDYGPGTEYKNISWTAFISWIIASVFGFIIKWGVQSINTLILGFVLYLVLTYLFQTLRINAYSGTTVEGADSALG